MEREKGSEMMSNVLAEIKQWAKTLPYWEQVALDKILKGVKFNKSDYDELLQYLLEDEGLEKGTGKRPQLKFINEADEVSQHPSEKVLLKRTFNLQNVNALVPGQSLTFGPALTSIYGRNASGKSGYARILGCAGFTRGDTEVIPDITKPTSPTTIPSADIEVSIGDSTRIIHYKVGDSCPELSAFYVFDSTSVQVHLTGSNAFSFSPAGLSYLTRLAEVTDGVRERLKAKIEKRSKPHGFSTLFQGESVVTEFMENIGPGTKTEELKQIAKLTQAEEKRFKQLDFEIAELKTKDIPMTIRKLRQTIEDFQDLSERLSEVKSKLSDDIISNIWMAVKVQLKRGAKVKQISVEQFKSEHFTYIGSDVWNRFVESAKALAEVEQTPDKLYPQDTDYCLLCHQPLSSEARQLLLHLWEFLESESQMKLEEAHANLRKKGEELSKIDLDFFNEHLGSYRYLQEHNEALLMEVTKFIDSCRQRRRVALDIIDAHSKENVYSEEPFPNIPENTIFKIGDFVTKLRTQRYNLEKESPVKKIAELEPQLLTLHHRKALNRHIPKIEKEIKKRNWVKRANEIKVSTRHITLKYNELFEKLVTNRYIQLFERTLRDLQRPLRVKVETKARKGEAYKHIVLETDKTVPVKWSSPAKVLSEGEKRAVALADFLTEVALDNMSSGIIMDDPVTSLDLEWRETIASILAKEAKHRQMMIFTHDLAFLYFLKKSAEQMNVEITSHWITRGDNDDKPGYVFLDNTPALERNYRKSTKAHEIYMLAKEAPPAEQEYLLRQGFGALRSAYEALIIFDMFNEVVMRFEERVSFGRLKNVAWNEKIADEVNSRCEYLSRYIEAHLHSNALGASKPTCEMLIREIEKFDALKNKIKKLKNR